MRNPLNKRIKRDLRSNIGRYVAIAFMMIVTISIISGFLIVSSGIKDTFINNREECKAEDGYFSSYYKISDKVKEEIEELDVSVYENYYYDSEDLDDITLRIYENRENIDIATVIKGSLPNNKSEIAIDRLFAESNNFNIGDSIKVAGENKIISGYISLPDYSSLFKNNTDLMMDAVHFGVAIVNKDTFDSFSSNKIIYKYSYYFNDRNLSNKDKVDLNEDIKNELIDNKVALNDFCTADNNQALSFIEDDMGSDVPTIKVLLVIILIIMAFVFSVIISGTIESEAPIIGTLLSSGYSKREMILHYIRLPIIVTTVSALIGNIGGYFVLPGIVKDMYYGSYCLPNMKISFNLEAFILTTVLPLAIMIIINILTLNKRLNISPLNFLRRDLKKHGNKRALKLPNVKFINRFRMRVIIQNKGSYFTMFLGIFLATFILMFSLIMTPYIKNYVDSIKESAVSKYQYILKSQYEVDNNNAEKFTMHSMNYYYKVAGKDLEVAFMGINEKSNFYSLSIDYNQEGGYFSNSFIDKIGAKIGDRVEFTDPYTEKKYDIKILGSYEYKGGLAVLMNQEKLNELFSYDKEYYNGYFSNEKLNISDDYLATVITPDDMANVGDQMLKSFKQMIPLVFVVAIVIYISLIYILTKLVIEKNTTNISFMKVFGYENKEVRRLYLQATTIVVIFSLILCIPLVNYSTKIAFKLALIKVNGYLPVYIPTYLYVETFIIGMSAYFIINFFHIKRVNKIDIAEALKSRE